MSLLRTVYLGAVLCGWMAFVGWFAAEILRQGVTQPGSAAGPSETADSAPRFLGSQTLGSVLANERNQTIAAFCLVGAAIGAGLGLASGLSNWQLRPQLLRMARGLAAGTVGGILGGWLGAMIYQAFSPTNADGSIAAPRWWLRPVGWMAAGALVGLADGVFTLSRNRMRNGLIGGLTGGLIGGILFDPIKALVAHTASAADPTFQFEITSRAAGFVAVGLCIGGAVGLTHLLLRHAWLTVLDGDRPGRQVILTGNELILGSDPSAGLPFLPDTVRPLLPAHLRIVRGRDGSFSLLPATPAADPEVTVVKNGIRQSYSFNNQNAQGVSLENDCVIICGRNSIRFNEKSQRGEAAGSSAATAAAIPARPAPSPPPKPAVLNQAQQAAQQGPAPPPMPQPRSVPQPPPPKRTEPGTAPESQQPIAHRDAATPAPAPMPTHRPPVAPIPAPKPPPAPRITPQPPSPQPQPTSPAANLCPNGHNVPAGQRYCMLCDTYF